ncbi:adenosylcobinamide-phosphate synthase CbiB [Martelella alba]|uniref:Cobalamin biosynthesis protein CobD n=1 Tax=Martelella alba TaxID=2590451 RepID=A0ABY2SQ10_9HYPH|nr:adenosylcobinamide-phosphate synthase CbiB [Martelella alba]TKI08040.1 cobalamin biosynthesis protein [Martelella alba]
MPGLTVLQSGVWATLGAFVAGYLLDLWLGDPPHWPHPVRWIGGGIELIQRLIRRYCRGEPALYAGGGLLWLAVVGGAWLAADALLRLLSFVPWLHWLVQTWLVYTLLATRCLRDAAMTVYRALRTGTLAESRHHLSFIVGRDTGQLSRPQIMRAVVETVAENSVDGVIAPLFWLFVGGVPLAMAYKAVNTLDSMVGYLTPKYRAIGYVSAKMDDLANWLPARLGWVALALAAGMLGLDWRSAWRIGWRDRHCHKSPNCAWSEAAVAGALGIRLGGPNHYFNQRVEKPWIGDARRDIALEDINAAIRLMYLASALALAFFLLLRVGAANVV